MHRFLHDGKQLRVELLQINFLAQGSAEVAQDRFRIVLSAIEAPVNNRLDASAHRQKEHEYCQRGNRPAPPNWWQLVVRTVQLGW
jgi:hypothetical protein